MSDKRMTVNQLHKQLTKLIEQGHKKKYVNVNKRTFTHPCEGDGCIILPVYSCEIELITNGDDDGGTKFNQDGSESMSTIAVIKGIDNE